MIFCTLLIVHSYTSFLVTCKRDLNLIWLSYAVMYMTTNMIHSNVAFVMVTEEPVGNKNLFQAPENQFRSKEKPEFVLLHLK